MTPTNRLFKSFWMAGFECSSQINSQGQRLDMTAAIQHNSECEQDYQRLRDIGIRAARDGLRWHLIDHGGQFDWSSWLPMLEAAQRRGIQVIWDLFHYGIPDGVDIFSPAFIDRFARFAQAAARIHREHSDETAFYSPMNEISFFAWAGTRDFMFPYAYGRDADLKRQLVRAAIAAIDGIRGVDPSARILSPEPLIHVAPAVAEPWNTEPLREQQNSQFEAWDMLCGHTAHELGGAERYLDILGGNFYSSNQWELPGGGKLHWDGGSNDPRWMPLHDILSEVYHRYNRPILIAETSHYGIGRAPWLQQITVEVSRALAEGVPLQGVCLYPILDRFDWEDPSHWHNSGLWDMKPNAAGGYDRVLNTEYASAFHSAQATLC